MAKRPSPLQNYSANQFESSFNPHRLGNWRVPYEQEGIVYNLSLYLLILTFSNFFFAYRTQVKHSKKYAHQTRMERLILFVMIMDTSSIDQRLAIWNVQRSINYQKPEQPVLLLQLWASLKY